MKAAGRGEACHGVDVQPTSFVKTRFEHSHGKSATAASSVGVTSGEERVAQDATAGDMAMSGLCRVAYHLKQKEDNGINTNARTLGMY